MLLEQVEQTPAGVRAFDLADGDEGMGCLGEQGRQVVIAAEDRIAEHGLGSLSERLDDAGDLVAGPGFDHVDAGAAVAAAAEEQQGLHRAAAAVILASEAASVASMSRCPSGTISVPWGIVDRI